MLTEYQSVPTNCSSSSAVSGAWSIIAPRATARIAKITSSGMTTFRRLRISSLLRRALGLLPVVAARAGEGAVERLLDHVLDVERVVVDHDALLHLTGLDLPAHHSGE